MATRIILNNGQTLDTNPEMDIEFKLTSPVFSRETGSQTISDTLPPTGKNRSELGFPGRTDNSYRNNTTFPIIVEDGSFIQPGEMAVHGTDEDGNILFNIGLDEGSMYAMMKEKKISELDNFYVYAPLGSTLKYKIQLCVQLLCENAAVIDNEYAFFPVVLKQDVIDNFPYSFILNTRKTDNNGVPVPNINSHNDVSWESRTIKQVINGVVANIDLPDGYGIAPFLKVWKVIEIIFENFGYKVIQNPFKTDFQLKLLTALHNVVDGLCMGTINYQHFVPDVPIIDFLDSLFYKFGAVYFVNSRTKEINIKLLKDILKDNNYNDITALKSNRLAWNNVPPKQLKLTANNGIAETQTLVSTFEEFLLVIRLGVQSKPAFEMIGERPMNATLTRPGFVFNTVSRRFFNLLFLHLNNF